MTLHRTSLINWCSVPPSDYPTLIFQRVMLATCYPTTKSLLLNQNNSIISSVNKNRINRSRLETFLIFLTISNSHLRTAPLPKEFKTSKGTAVNRTLVSLWDCSLDQKVEPAKSIKFNSYPVLKAKDYFKNTPLVQINWCVGPAVAMAPSTHRRAAL